MISFDTETTGLDLRHGARPFFVTICGDSGEQKYWEFDVDPSTRKVSVILSDWVEILETINTADKIVLQNGKFDVAAVDSGLKDAGLTYDWRWDVTEDTIIASHLLNSLLPHDLTSLAVRYLGLNIEKYEKAVEEAVKECRRPIQQARLRLKRGNDSDIELAYWSIAEDDDPTLPSGGGWRADYWLPRAMAQHQKLSADHHYWTVLRDYANADSAVTYCLWQAMEKEINRRDLMKLYRERMKVIPIAYSMESRGVTLSGSRLEEQTIEYREESERAGRTCVEIAKRYNYDLKLPKGANNNSLRTFMLDEQYLGLPPVYNKKAKSAAPTLDSKNAIPHYLETLPPGSKSLLFVRSLVEKRKRDTAVAYMESYRRFWRCIDEEEGWYVLHPFLNPTGTATLRWSSASPNEQNISKREGFNLRHSFGPAPGREWYSLDARNIELRLPAYEADETEMVELFEQPDAPPFYGSNHMLIFSIIWPEIWEKHLKEVGPEKVASYCKKAYASTNYQWTKNGNFAVQYGAVDREDGTGTADRAYHLPGAQAMISKRFSKLDALNQKCIRTANKLGYVETIPDKTVDPRRGYPLVCSRTERGYVKPTIPLNYHVQGSAMWWMMRAMIRCYDQLTDWNKKGFDGFIAMQVHDELVFDFPKRAHPKKNPKASNLGRIREMQRLMQLGGDGFGIPTPVSIEYHDSNWSEGVSL